MWGQAALLLGTTLCTEGWSVVSLASPGPCPQHLLPPVVTTSKVPGGCPVRRGENWVRRKAQVQREVTQDPGIHCPDFRASLLPFLPRQTGRQPQRVLLQGRELVVVAFPL